MCTKLENNTNIEDVFCQEWVLIGVLKLTKVQEVVSLKMVSFCHQIEVYKLANLCHPQIIT